MAIELDEAVESQSSCKTVLNGSGWIWLRILNLIWVLAGHNHLEQDEGANGLTHQAVEALDAVSRLTEVILQLWIRFDHVFSRAQDVDARDWDSISIVTLANHDYKTT